MLLVVVLRMVVLEPELETVGERREGVWKFGVIIVRKKKAIGVAWREKGHGKSGLHCVRLDVFGAKLYVWYIEISKQKSISLAQPTNPNIKLLLLHLIQHGVMSKISLRHFNIQCHVILLLTQLAIPWKHMWCPNTIQKHFLIFHFEDWLQLVWKEEDCMAGR